MTESSSGAGCGLMGCLGGAVLGLVGGAFLAVTLALILAVNAPTPNVTPAAGSPDIKITLTEEFLNRYVEQPADGSVAINLKPANQVQVEATTVADVLGLPMPVQVSGLFQFEATPQALRVNLLDTQVFGLNVELSGIFDEDIALINQNISTMMQDVSHTLGAPMTLSNFSTSETAIELEMQETR